MSPLLIGALVAGGLLALISIGFISHSLERTRLERARLVADLSARLKYCETVNTQLPGQFMTAELKTQLINIEIALLEQLLRADHKNEKAKRHLESAKQQIAQGEPAIANPPATIASEAKAKEIRILLEHLHKLLSQAHKDGMLDKTAMQFWSIQIRQHLTTTALEMFQALAKQGMQQGKPRIAKLQYERAIAYLQKHNNPLYAKHMERYKQLVVETEQTIIRSELAAGANTSELSSGLKELEQEDEAWKKKAVYDD